VYNLFVPAGLNCAPIDCCKFVAVSDSVNSVISFIADFICLHIGYITDSEN